MTGNTHVVSYHKLKPRKIGNDIAVDVHIQLDKNLTFVDAHNITMEVERTIKTALGKNAYINIHTEPIDVDSSQNLL